MHRGKRNDENLHQYKERIIDPISKSYCAAKWYNATIWLGHGQTTSCHHPPGHNIPIEELKDNFNSVDCLFIFFRRDLPPIIFSK